MYLKKAAVLILSALIILSCVSCTSENEKNKNILLSYDLQKNIEENYLSPGFSVAYRAAPVLKNLLQKEEEYFLRLTESPGGLTGDRDKGGDLLR